MSPRTSSFKPVIMAGGNGTRLWPLSRRHQPKQNHIVLGEQSMVRQTFQRLRQGFRPQDIFVSSNVSQLNMLRQQLPGLPRANFILEPERRDTAPAIGLAAVTLWARDKKASMFTVSSDHYFRETSEYIRLVNVIGQVVQRHPTSTVLMGVKPAYPHTGLGYIKMRDQADRLGQDEIFRVDRFVEKPNMPMAKRFVTDWHYLWNIGVFAFRVDAMLEKYRQWLPKSYRALMQIAPAIGTSRERATIKKWFPKLEKTSIDYGIMEHDRHMLVVPAAVTWADIGSWREVYDMLADESSSTVSRGRHVAHDSHGNLIFSYSGRLIATAGLRDMIVVETADAILVCPRDRAQDVKHLVAELERQGLKKFL